MNKLKKYFIEETLENSADPFERMRITLTYNLVIIWLPLSILTTIPLVIGKYWFIIIPPFITSISSVIALYLLRKKQSYALAGKIWVLTSVSGLLIIHILGSGIFRGIDVLWSLLFTIIGFVLLDKKTAISVFIFTSTLMLVSILVYLKFIPSYDFPQFEHELEHFSAPSIISFLLPLYSIGYVLYSFLSAQEKAQGQLALQKKNLDEQKRKIEAGQKEIEDSLFYAKRIQTALLPSDHNIEHAFNDIFILYKPKSIVSGDFYWLQTQNDTIYFSVADCTGHGVPGAMISVLCMKALNRAVLEDGLNDPGKILDKAREFIIDNFEKSKESIQDGMDISFCALNTKNHKLTWSGANNPLWVVRNNTKKLEEIKPNRQPVGEYEKKESFKSHTIQLAKNDMLYLTTDGFYDQFGGENGKKYRKLNLKNKILEIVENPVQTQLSLLEAEFENWKGELEQLDDICIMGVKIG